MKEIAKAVEVATAQLKATDKVGCMANACRDKNIESDECKSEVRRVVRVHAANPTLNPVHVPYST